MRFNVFSRDVTGASILKGINPNSGTTLPEGDSLAVKVIMRGKEKDTDVYNDLVLFSTNDCIPGVHEIDF